MRIQDIKQLSGEIYDLVDEYISEIDCYASPKLKVSRHDGQIDIEIVDTDEMIDTADVQTYDMARLVCLEADGEMFPNLDEVNQVANEWIFID